MNKEVLKCLKCKNAKCTIACPIATPVAEVMTLYQEHRQKEAAKMLFENNPFAYVCSLVCNYEKQCYGNCILNYKNVPVKFYEIEEELSKTYLEELSLTVTASKDAKVAIIGAGPAGITAAIRLARLGYQITIFDQFAEIGGILRYGIPEERLPKASLKHYVRILKELKVKFVSNCKIGKDLTFEELKKKYDAIAVTIGAWIPKPIGIKGANEKIVINAIEYLKNPNDYQLGAKTIVIGAGNVAMDSAYTASMQGVDTSIYYRKTAKQMPASEKEVAIVVNSGVKFEFLNVPAEIVKDGIYFDKGKVIEVDGKYQTKILPNTRHFVKCDSVIVAISQQCDIDFLKQANLETNNYNTVIVTDDFKTNDSQVFAAGDVVRGPDTVVAAVNQASKMADAIADYLTELKKL